MATIEKSVEVNVPVRTAYNQWTQFEEFPRFMEGVRLVKQKDDTHLRWVANISGNEEEWDAEISEQIPDKRIAWHSTEGANNAGVVTFHYIDQNVTRVNLQMDYDPESFSEKVGDRLGFVTRRVEGDLKRFKEFIETRGEETGAWRGEVDHPSDREPGGRSGMREGTMRSEQGSGARTTGSGERPMRPEDPDVGGTRRG